MPLLVNKVLSTLQSSGMMILQFKLSPNVLIRKLSNLKSDLPWPRTLNVLKNRQRTPSITPSRAKVLKEYNFGTKCREMHKPSVRGNQCLNFRIEIQYAGFSVLVRLRAGSVNTYAWPGTSCFDFHVSLRFEIHMLIL